MSHARSGLRFAVDSHHSVLSIPQRGGSREKLQAAIDDLIAFARTADRAGVDSFWLTEDPDGWDALAMLGAIARETERIRLGPGVLNPYYRHPALAAASMSTLDALSDGRAFLGFGRGQPEWYDRGLGMDVGSPLHALEESFQLLRQWFERKPFQDGVGGSGSDGWIAAAAPDATQFKVTRWERVIGPVQERLPIYLAAAGPKALSLAARYADGVIFNELTSATFMARTIRDVRAEAAAFGRDPNAMSFFARSGVTITDDPERVWEQRKVTIAIIHTLPGMARLLETPGFDAEAIIARVREVMHTDEVLARGGNFADLRRAGDFAAARALIPTELMRELLVAGSVEEVRERLKALREIGVTDVFLSRPGPDAMESLGDIVAALSDA